MLGEERKGDDPLKIPKSESQLSESSRAPEMARGCCQVLADSEGGWLGGSEGIATKLVERH